MSNVILFLLIILGLVSAYLHRSIMRYVHKQYPEKWNELGKEDFTGKIWKYSLNIPMESWAGKYFILFDNKIGIDDPKIRKKCFFYRTIFLVDAILLVMFVVLLVWR